MGSAVWVGWLVGEFVGRYVGFPTNLHSREEKGGGGGVWISSRGDGVKLVSGLLSHQSQGAMLQSSVRE